MAAAAAAWRTDTLAASLAILLVLSLAQRLVGFVRQVLVCRWLEPSRIGPVGHCVQILDVGRAGHRTRLARLVRPLYRVLPSSRPAKNAAAADFARLHSVVLGSAAAAHNRPAGDVFRN